MPYTPDEYEKLKAAYKEELRHRKAILEAARRAQLRQKAEWHLSQMQSALEALGYSPEPPPQEASEMPTSPSPEAQGPTETKTLF